MFIFFISSESKGVKLDKTMHSLFIIYIGNLVSRSTAEEETIPVFMHGIYFLDPSNAEATFVQSTKTQTFLKSI